MDAGVDPGFAKRFKIKERPLRAYSCFQIDLLASDISRK